MSKCWKPASRGSASFTICITIATGAPMYRLPKWRRASPLPPVFYAHANFGAAPPTPGQRRFICDLDSFARLLEGCRAIAARLDGANVGVAPHSLRAVAPEELAGVCAMAGAGPIHIHVAEQIKEVEDCLAWSGARPVAWL